MTEKPKLHFQRYEFKYHIPTQFADKLVPALLKYMDFDPHVKGNKDNAYEVHSIYLDSPNLKNYHEKIEGDLFRKKLRMRSYTKDVKKDTPIFVEIKRKYNMVIIKDRITTTPENAIKLAEENIISKIPKVGDDRVLDEFMQDKLLGTMTPKVLISYKRKPLVGRTGSNLRVTFDYDIQAARTSKIDFSKPTKPIYPGMLIMEVKFNDILPYWLHEIIQKHTLEAWPYSKYCFGMEFIKPSLRQMAEA